VTPALIGSGRDARKAGFVRSRQMRQKIPERLEIIDEMPRNATGKLEKNELRARFEQIP